VCKKEIGMVGTKNPRQTFSGPRKKDFIEEIRHPEVNRGRQRVQLLTKWSIEALIREVEDCV